MSRFVEVITPSQNVQIHDKLYVGGIQMVVVAREELDDETLEFNLTDVELNAQLATTMKLIIPKQTPINIIHLV